MQTQSDCSNILIGTPWRQTCMFKASLVIWITTMQSTVLTCLRSPNILLSSVLLTVTGNYCIYNNFIHQVTKYTFILYFLRDTLESWYSMENTFVIYTNFSLTFSVLFVSHSYIHKKIILHCLQLHTIYMPHFYMLTYALDYNFCFLFLSSIVH